MAVALVVAFIVKTFVAQAFSIPSTSMTPQLEVGDRVVVSKLAYRFHDPRRGDIVVFDSPQATEAADDDPPFPLSLGRDLLEAVGLVDPGTEELIKRVVGLPGERVEAHGGHVFIDGRQLAEPYLPAGVTTQDFAPVVIPEDHLFMMGDNRGGSNDSRRFGPISEDLIVGRAVAKVWPPGGTSFL